MSSFIDPSKYYRAQVDAFAKLIPAVAVFHALDTDLAYYQGVICQVSKWEELGFSVPEIFYRIYEHDLESLPPSKLEETVYTVGISKDTPDVAIPGTWLLKFTKQQVVTPNLLDPTYWASIVFDADSDNPNNDLNTATIQRLFYRVADVVKLILDLEETKPVVATEPDFSSLIAPSFEGDY